MEKAAIPVANKADPRYPQCLENFVGISTFVDTVYVLLCEQKCMFTTVSAKHSNWNIYAIDIKEL